MEYKSDISILETDLNVLGEQLETLIIQSQLLIEKQTDDIVTDQMLAAFDKAMKQFAAAKRGMGLVNKLEPGPSRAKHASRVMSNMNRIRGTIAKIEKMLKTSRSE